MHINTLNSVCKDTGKINDFLQVRKEDLVETEFDSILILNQFSNLWKIMSIAEAPIISFLL